MLSKTANPLCAALLQAQEANGGRPVTAKSVKTNAVYIQRLVDDGLVVDAPERLHTGRRGRPARLVRLTDRGRARARGFLVVQAA